MPSAVNANESNSCSKSSINNASCELAKSNGKSGTKRQNYLEWQEYFMSIAFLSAQRSKDPRTQVGACIVNKDKKIVGIGYNGMPLGCSDEVMPWNRPENETKEKWLQSKSPYVCHAELNAVLNKNLADISGCSIYVALFPCNMCAQIIIQSGITEVIYYSDKYHDKPEFVASRFLMDTSGVKYRQFRPRQKKIVIDFELIESTAGPVPTLPTPPPTLPLAISCNGETPDTDLRQRATSSTRSSHKNNENNSFTDKDAAIKKIQADSNNAGGQASNNADGQGQMYDNLAETDTDSNVGHLADTTDSNADGSSATETQSELFHKVSKNDVEVRFALMSMLFIVGLVLLVWHTAMSLDDSYNIPVSTVRGSSSSVSFTPAADNPLF